MATDIFDFWSQIGPTDNIHPADKEVFSRLGPDGHQFNHNTLPACYMGPLRTAPVVMLFMSPGFKEEDEKRAATPEEQDRYVRTRQGNEPLPPVGVPGGEWWRKRVKCLKVDVDKAATKVAILNIGAYHSKDMLDPELLAALPSSRVSLDWAQNVLFPQAIKGERVVICLRSAKFWGLRRGGKPVGQLFAPEVNRAGDMLNGPDREKIISTVQRALNVE